ncbi:hypothetical protein BDQ94DRAFT_149317 [Aspergillus welwitschiae]|uniref:Uncharacterized protein n=1 Tax=Aspergillus welwitschiae TaxID=1341132 RepID=A0A3F3PTM4_9EURO|nr:hypothetical protein BDQ94DRAFT_149317 [Aspergillus welwitschiae]RDH30274.1 hypothetical protein BDQ94DRAFT_149317 [Aspergillus welwitschiae]
MNSLSVSESAQGYFVSKCLYEDLLSTWLCDNLCSIVTTLCTGCFLYGKYSRFYSY